MQGTDLPALRHRARISQAELARRVGVHPSALCNWEKGVKPLPQGREHQLLAAISAYTPPRPGEWFWSRVDARGDDTCWPWLGGRWKHGGYGYLRHGGKALTASRVAWELTNGPIPKGLWVLHSCDNPPCCNPGHLFLGDAQSNVDDMLAKRRGGQARAGLKKRGEANGQAKLTEAEVRRLRHEAAGGETQGAIAARYGVSRGLVSMIVNRRYWSHVT